MSTPSTDFVKMIVVGGFNKLKRPNSVVTRLMKSALSATLGVVTEDIDTRVNDNGVYEFIIETLANRTSSFLETWRNVTMNTELLSKAELYNVNVRYDKI